MIATRVEPAEAAMFASVARLNSRSVSAELRRVVRQHLAETAQSLNGASSTEGDREQ